MADVTRSVAVCVVSHNSGEDLPACLASIAKLEFQPLEVAVVDCASSDDSVEVIRLFSASGIDFKWMALEENIGFAGGMNQAIRLTRAPFVITLNPDARPHPDFVDRLVHRACRHIDLRVGAVAGRLRRFQRPGTPRILDACGMRLTTSWRHLDRGSGQPDVDRWTQADRVFGATGAASLWNRIALEDVAVGDQVFLEEFHSFREDAELCFRLRERGWEILYEPGAMCEHRRRSLPSNRAAQSPEINYHSLKNRYLLRAYHQDLMNLPLTLFPAIGRDLMALMYVFLFEQSSLAVYRWLFHNRAFIRNRRRRIRERRTQDSWEINRWFFRKNLPL